LEKFAMKKTLIALAALASTAAFAQSSVTLTGKLIYGYEATKSAAGAKANGLKVTDGDLNVAVVEDLGGGLKAGANMAFVSRGRDTAITGRDASVSLSGGFGSVMIGSIEAGNGILGLGGAGAPVYGLDDGTTLAKASNVDIIKYTSPAMNGFTVSVNATDATAGLGMEAAATTQDSTGAGVAYANGPLAAAADYTSYGLNAATATNADTRTRMSASYDLGMAKVGFGYQTATSTANVSKKENVFGVSVPMGALTLGMVVASSKTDGVAGTNKGTDLGAKYALSKRTFIAAAYQTTKAAGATASASKYRVQLGHSF
jgi:predicted porin